MNLPSLFLSHLARFCTVFSRFNSYCTFRNALDGCLGRRFKGRIPNDRVRFRFYSPSSISTGPPHPMHHRPIIIHSSCFLFTAPLHFFFLPFTIPGRRSKIETFPSKERRTEDRWPLHVRSSRSLAWNSE